MKRKIEPGYDEPARQGEWYAVVNSARVVLAVYGSALQNEALEKLERLRFTEIGTQDRCHLVVCQTRPAVGGILPAEGQRGEEGD